MNWGREFQEGTACDGVEQHFFSTWSRKKKSGAFEAMRKGLCGSGSTSLKDSSAR